MRTRTKLQITAAALLLVALGILLKPPAESSLSTPSPASRSRPTVRIVKPSSHPARSRDFRTFVQQASQSKFPKLTAPEIDTYLEAQHRSAGSLLAAFKLSEDEAFLREAMEKFPNDPQVLLASLRLAGDESSRLEILNSLKLADPDNSLADCLSARILFDQVKDDEAFAALSAVSGKPIDDYTILGCQAVEEAYLAAGFSPVEAKMTSLYNATKPYLMQMPNVSDGLKRLRERDQAAGDDAAVQASREIQLEMARQIGEGGFVIDMTVASLLENRVFREIDSPESHARIEEIEQEKQSMIADSKQISAMLENTSVPESDWLLYFDRAKLFGEKAANRWMLEKHPNP